MITPLSERPGSYMPSNARRWMFIAVLVALTLLSIKGFFLGQRLLAVRQDYDSLRPLLTASPGELTQPANIVKMEALLSRTESDLGWLRDEVGPLFGVLPLFAWVPQYGEDIEQAGLLVDYGIHVAASGRMVLKMYPTLIRQIPEGGGLSKDLSRGKLLLQAADAIRPDLDGLEAQLALAVSARQRIDPRRLSPSVANLIRRGDSILNVGTPALRAVDLLPELLGERGVRRYLLIAQNNDELRATGGYISGVGMIEVQDGQITRANFQDSYAVEDYSKPHPAPPQPLLDYMGAEQWTVRDANWSPDFPTSAKNIQALYELNQGVRVDGVIAVNLNAVQRLVAALGPIELPAYGERVDGENVLARMQYYLYSPEGAGQTGDWWSHRKDFTAALMERMVARLNGEHGPLNALGVGQALWTSLSAKEIFIYLNDPASRAILHDLGWDGALPTATQDVVLVVDSNVGWTKADGKIERRFDYRVELRPGQPALASLRIQYRNLNPASAKPCILEVKYEPTYADMENACYWDYVRVYVPLGSKPLSATSGISATLDAPELGHAVLSGYFLVPRGETREIRFDYELPFAGLQRNGLDEYHLTWIKQPGAPPASVTATIAFPSAWQVIDAEPALVSQGDATVVLVLAPDGDAHLSVQFAPAVEWSRNVPLSLGGLVILAGLLAVVLRQSIAALTSDAEPRSRRISGWMGLGFVVLILAVGLGWIGLQSATSSQPAVTLKPPSTIALVATAVPVQAKLPTATIAPSPAATVTPVPTATQTTLLAPTATSTRVPIPSPSATTLAPTATTSPPTAASALRYPAPRLLAPGNSLTIARVSIDLKWSPVGNLQADEWYDVQVWKPDETPHGVSWTKEGAWTMPADFPSGKYQWRIVVIRGHDGKWLEDVSPPSETWTLNRQ